jgi:sulfate transport system permease protein
MPTLREIGDEQEQAARTLGANGWQTFWRITPVDPVGGSRRRADDGPLSWRVRRGRCRLRERRGGSRPRHFVQDAHGNFNQAGAYGIALVLAAMSVIVRWR